ncbi:MAG: hypothetical protein R2874_05155 [Desulfobacterales bacterium]
MIGLKMALSVSAKECGEEISIKRLKSGLSPPSASNAKPKKKHEKRLLGYKSGIVDLHIHSTASDGSIAPLDILTRWPKTRILLLLP